MASFGLFGVVIVFLNYGSISSQQFRYDYTYNERVGGWLKLHVIPASFHEAFMMCKAEGSILASPLNEQLRQAMLNLFKTKSADSCALYTGVHATISKGAFTSIEGVPLSKMRMVWAPFEPDNYKNNEDCIVILQNGTMADTRCTDTFPYVCYKRNTNDLFINDCGTTDNGYELNTLTGSCYKFHYEGHTWNRAYAICMAEGGHLAVINSKVEAQFLKELFDNTALSSIKTSNKRGVSIGFRDWSDHTMWLTVQGQTLEEAGYAKWAPGEPNNEKEKCGSILRDVKGDGVLNDASCNLPLAFICEMTPNTLNLP